MNANKCECNYNNTQKRCTNDSSLLVSVYHFNPMLRTEIFSKDVKCCGKHVRTLCVKEINEGKTIRLFKRTKERDLVFYEPYGLINIKNLPVQQAQRVAIVPPTVPYQPPVVQPPVEEPVEQPVVLTDVLTEGKHPCCICFDDTEDVFCTSHRHVMCNECFSGHVTAESHHIDFKGTVKCPLHRLKQCDCQGFSVSFVAKHASEEAFTEYDRKRYEIKEKSMMVQIEADLKKKLTLENKESVIDKDLRYIRENILTLKCPKCNHAYDPYFDGCMAVKCINCHQYFCAKCHAQYNNDQLCHNHVNKCKLNNSPLGLFHHISIIRMIQNEMRKRKLQIFLVRKPHKKDLLNALKIDLLDLGI